MRSRGRSLFPVGLYAGLLAALLAALRPDAVAPIERIARSIVVLPFRAWGGVGAQPAQAADTERAQRWVEEFWRHAVLAAEATRPEAIGEDELEPVFCAVTARRRGALVLDVPWSEIGAEWPTFVTVGDALVGFLGPRGRASDRAEVRLLEGTGRRRRARGVAARVATDDGHELRFVVEPAEGIDPWPLRCELLDDPYRAARIERDGQLVTTRRLPGDPLGEVPSGLRIGALRVWGYESDGRRLPIGFFVEPAADVRGAPVVALWRPPRGARTRTLERFTPRRVPVRSFELALGRWFCAVPFDGAAPRAGSPLVRGDRLVGYVASAGPGYAIVAPYGEVGGNAEELLWMAADGVVRRVSARVVHADRRVVRMACTFEGVDGAPAARGSLFTSSADEGVAGLWLGEARLTDDVGQVFEIERLAAGASADGMTILVDLEGVGG